jgi:hypothetical protein
MPVFLSNFAVSVKILKLQNHCQYVVEGGQKSMCLAVKGRLQGRTAKLLLARWMSWCNEDIVQICLAANSFIAFGNRNFKATVHQP